MPWMKRSGCNCAVMILKHILVTLMTLSRTKKLVIILNVLSEVSKMVSGTSIWTLMDQNIQELVEHALWQKSKYSCIPTRKFLDLLIVKFLSFVFIFILYKKN